MGPHRSDLMTLGISLSSRQTNSRIRGRIEATPRPPVSRPGDLWILATTASSAGTHSIRSPMTRSSLERKPPPFSRIPPTTSG